ncbi:enoyl-CoA hydratase-related protein [Anaerovorax odorimutans]|uniref:enoyl-CoA hydratase-related protein n=1 Tax=Anaerovorax odorimutans TaxID=109327 RepID=UPI0003FFA23C|nr:enoyl-CoA hydratase-related protein [Anaerovorax odorimutans]
MYQNLKYEVKDSIAYITVNRPKSLNALNGEVLDDLLAAFTEVEKNPEVKIAILTGEGRAFVAGADISQMVNLTGLEGQELMKQGQKVMNFIEEITKPVIAAINGFALGGGCELAMACDIRVASEAAKFGQPEVNLGIIPGFGGTQRLPRLVGKGMGKYLIMTAEMIDANEAYRIGLVEKIVPGDELISTCEKIAKTIMSKAPIAVKHAKIAVNNGIMLDVKTGVAYEGEACAAPFCSDDRKEGMNAFLEKRAAKFENK